VLCFELSRGSRWPPLNGADAPVSYEPSSRFESKFDRAGQASMMRIFYDQQCLALALAVPAAAQPRSVSNALERLHTLCEQNYKPACIRLGVFIAGLPPSAGRRLRRDHPEWWWWERW